jgi:hypothetical protein
MAKLLEAGKLTSLTGKTWKIKVIEGDRQGSSAYYPKEVLEAGKHLFKEGTRIFRNHPSSEAKWNQPERRIEDIIGYLSEDATFDGKDLYANATFLESEQARIKELAEAGLIAMSIRAEGEMTEGANGMEVARFTAVHSVDVVTTAGAGGAFEKLLESANENNSQEENLVEAQEEETELELPKEFLDALDNLTKGVNTLNESLAEEKSARELAEAARVKALEEAEKPKELSFSEVTEALVESGLSAKARTRVLTAVEGGADLTEAIKAEKEIAEEILAEAAKGAGAGHIEESGAPKAFDFASVYGG